MRARRLGLLGGTFDPPHVGHLVAAACAHAALDLDEVQLVVAGRPWMKDDWSDPEDRVRMVELAVEGDDTLVTNRDEIDRGGVTYTVDTLRAILSEHPDVEAFFLLGADAAARLPEWREVDEALGLATFVALGRPGHDVAFDGPILGQVEQVEMPAIGISSTDLRRRFRDGEPVRHQLPRAVEDYVRARGLYGASPDGGRR